MEMEVKSFKALRYDSGVVGDVGSCISPPYDVINAEQQQDLYERNEYNIVRIIKGKLEPSDDGTNNQYTRAAKYLNSWVEKGALRKDDADAIYGYVQDFQIAGKDYHRLSFIALAKLEEFGKIVRPHEQTLSGPKVDRLNLKRATKAKFGLNKLQLVKLLAGDTIPANFDLDEGYLILSLHDRYVLGLGLLIDGRIRSQISRKALKEVML